MKYFLFLVLLCGQLTSCMLKSQHEASLAEYQQRAQDTQQLQQENNVLKQQVSDLELRNQDLSTLNQQLVIKNKQLTENQFNQKNQSLDKLKKNQHSKQTYLNIYDQLTKKFDKNALILNDDYVGIQIKRELLFAGAKPTLSSSGESLLQQVIEVLPSPLHFAIEVNYQNQDQAIKRWLEKTYISQHSLRAFESALISNYFSKATHVKARSAYTTLGSTMTNNSDDVYTLKISHLP